MKARAWIFFVVLAGVCWGTYVPLVAQGGRALDRNSYASLLCVGVAYFLIAVLFPIAIMTVRGKWPRWTASGITFATLAGVAGALGALGVILATVEFKGPRIFVAPLIFALAPVINTVFSLLWHPDRGPLAFGLPQERPHWTLYLGILLAAIGAGMVLFSKEYPEWLKASAAQPATTDSRWWILFVAMAGLCWGTYVPLIAQGGKELKNSYASFLCVGVAYFLLAVLIPVVIMSVRNTWPAWTSEDGTLNPGVVYATLSGTAGALGALCVIFATFEFKGPKIFVAPLIFALAPVINTVFSLFWHPEKGGWVFEAPTESVHPTLFVGIVAAGCGAGLVLFSKEYAEWLHAQKREHPPAVPAPQVS
jgi:drug/metabolite transporter (DMT)-like permease